MTDKDIEPITQPTTIDEIPPEKIQPVDEANAAFVQVNDQFYIVHPDIVSLLHNLTKQNKALAELSGAGLVDPSTMKPIIQS